MPYKEWNVEQVYWDIGEVAEIFELATSKLRFWEQEGLFPQAIRKGRSGNRKFVRTDFEVIHDLIYMQDKIGMTIEGMHQAKDKGYIKKIIKFHKEVG
jgi:DNA-binding transcriptional MerR regulator